MRSSLPRVGLALRANLAASLVGARLRRVRSPRYADHPGGPLSSNATRGRHAVPTLPNKSTTMPRRLSLPHYPRLSHRCHPRPLGLSHFSFTECTHNRNLWECPHRPIVTAKPRASNYPSKNMPTWPTWSPTSCIQHHNAKLVLGDAPHTTVRNCMA